MSRQAQRYSVLAFGVVLLLSIAPSDAKEHPEGTHILVMVVESVPKQSILASGETGVLGQLHAEGIGDDDLSDGSVAVGIVYCCGGKISRDTAVIFYVPPEFRTQKGDVTEVRLGKTVTKKERERGDPGAINRAVTIRESFEDEQGACRWDPPNEKLWMRVLYCDWMLGEGWERRGGLSPGWFLGPAEQ